MLASVQITNVLHPVLSAEIVVGVVIETPS